MELEKIEMEIEMFVKYRNLLKVRRSLMLLGIKFLRILNCVTSRISFFRSSISYV